MAIQKFLQFICGEQTYVGITDGQGVVQALSYKDMSECIKRNFEVTLGERFLLNEIDFLPPVWPRKIMCLGWNYAEHIDEMKGKKPDHPMLFYKPTSAITAHNQNVVLPPSWLTSEVHNEVELAVVMGRKAKRVSVEDALDYVCGYTVIQDITARDIQSKAKDKNEQWEIAKSFDTFAPLGPWITPKKFIPDPNNLNLTLRVNGAVRQNSNTKFMVFKAPEIISYLSQGMTLEPGDVIATGTPKGVDAIRDGDLLEAEIEGIGVLKNTVVQEK